jgi:hypothetical protein
MRGLAVVALALAGCADVLGADFGAYTVPTTPSPDAGIGSGGQRYFEPGTGGAGTGGAAPTGSGGSVPLGSGGSEDSGAPEAGGAPDAGSGSPGSGGVVWSYGGAAQGGAQGTGGEPSTGGVSSSGGTMSALECQQLNRGQWCTSQGFDCGVATVPGCETTIGPVNCAYEVNGFPTSTTCSGGWPCTKNVCTHP